MHACLDTQRMRGINCMGTTLENGAQTKQCYNLPSIQCGVTSTSYSLYRKTVIATCITGTALTIIPEICHILLTDCIKGTVPYL